MEFRWTCNFPVDYAEVRVRGDLIVKALSSFESVLNEGRKTTEY